MKVGQPVIYLVSYDLNKHERPSAYDDVQDALEDNTTSMIRALYSQWLVETDLSLVDIRDALREVMDTDDRLLIVPIRKRADREGWLGRKVWEWLNERVPS